MQLILASTSPYRAMLLERLQLPFDTAAPNIDEAPLAGEHPAQTAERLSADKARVIAARHSSALIIGSDQVAYMGARQFGKPGTVERAIEQLRQMSGQTVTFHTGLAVINARTGHTQIRGVPTHVRFRSLSDQEISRYVEREMPLDCAGAAKVESLGISLLEALSGDDPTALIGLPLIALCDMLRAEGLDLP
ncbi:Maf family protein [Nitrogeniibacter aestuarii]|uniref:Maf family protein n=1 Tax=Nitrogeniibacter aestuarii TaxID=2815343 RepID=UPI001E491DD1|nr:Maf family nucleotide pyrophosphatase [Nitrogeniibacter aestuarii]